MTRRFLLQVAPAVLLLAVLASPPVSAQTSPVLHQRVRVTTSTLSGSEARYVGVVTSLQSDTLRLVDAGQMRALPVPAIHGLEVSRGRRGHALVGALIGAGLGVAAAAATVGSDDLAAVVVYPASVGLYGGLGALVGWVIKTERWQTLPAETLRRP